jgi:SAM-dependent methyltransferase
MFGKGEAQAERLWPKASEEESTRRKSPADWQRYDFAAKRVRGARVLDCACGAGYGTSLLARAGAVRAVGVDVAADALEWARREYSSPVTEFRHASGDTLPVADGEFDCVVSLETIEHIAPDRAASFVAELARALRAGGLLVLSTPLTYGSARIHPENPFHLREYIPSELEDLLRPHFDIDERFGQHSRLSRSFADIARTPGLGSFIRAGVHRLLPRAIRRVLRSLLLRPSGDGPECWITSDRWQEAAVQLVVARKR